MSKTYVVVVSSLIVLSIAFILSGNFSLTGHAIYDGENQTNQSLIQVSREMALEAINNSEMVMERMMENNFSIIYMNDSLIEAQRAFQRADYAEILRGNVNATTGQKAEARTSMSLIDIKLISYNDVMNYTQDIELREKKAFEIYDSISIVNKSINKYNGQGINVSEAEGFLGLASNSFYADRYSEAEKFIQLSRASLDKLGSEASILGDLKRGLIGFIQRYWASMLLIAIILILFGKVIYRRAQLINLNLRLKRIRVEEKVLVDLMKCAQEERFKENKISGLVYNVRMKKYKEKLEDLKQELPVLEQKLRDLVKQK